MRLGLLISRDYLSQTTLSQLTILLVLCSGVGVQWFLKNTRLLELILGYGVKAIEGGHTHHRRLIRARIGQAGTWHIVYGETARELVRYVVHVVRVVTVGTQARTREFVKGIVQEFTILSTGCLGCAQNLNKIQAN